GLPSAGRGGFQTRPGATNAGREIAHRSRYILADEPETRCGIPEVVRGFQDSPRAASMNVAAGAAPCGSVAITSTSFVMRKRSIAFAITLRIILRAGRMTRTIS